MRLSRHLGTFAFSMATGLWLLLSGQPLVARTWPLPPHSDLSVQGDLSEEVYNALRPQMQELFSNCQFSMNAITPSGQLIPHYFPAPPTVSERLEDGTMITARSHLRVSTAFQQVRGSQPMSPIRWSVVAGRRAQTIATSTRAHGDIAA
jgi:hypothetical protein